MSTDISLLVAKSASHSSKRTRILFDVNPQAVFIPAVDPNIADISIARRKRRIQPNISSQQVKSTSNALAVVSESNIGGSMGSPASGFKTSTALVRTHDEGASDEPTAGGILVVSHAAPIIQCRMNIALCD
jgi:ribosomal protein L28